MRTLVVTVSPLLADLVADALKTDAPVDIVEVLSRREYLPARLRELAPELLLLGLADGEGDHVATPLLPLSPTTRILTLAPDGRDASLQWVDAAGVSRRRAFSDFSAADLALELRALRAAGRKDLDPGLGRI